MTLLSPLLQRTCQYVVDLLELRSVTCRIGSHNVTCHTDTDERASPQPQPDRPVLDLPAKQG